MGYRSDVRIVTSKEGFKELEKFVKEKLKDLNEEEYNLLKDLDIKVEGKEQCYFGWNSIKWYEGSYREVDAIVEGLHYLQDKDYTYRYSRIGESYDDYDERCYDSENREEIVEFPSIYRGFEDEYLENLIIDYPEQVKEENKESVDYE